MASFLQFSDYQDSHARITMSDFGAKFNMTSIKFLKETLAKEINLVLMFKDEFEYGEKSI